MRAIGIDPGTAICGYGVVEQIGGRIIPQTFGAITTSPQARMQDRLLKIYMELDIIVKKFQPQVMGVEKLFFGRNATTAIPVGQAVTATTRGPFAAAAAVAAAAPAAAVAATAATFFFGAGAAHPGT